MKNPLQLELQLKIKKANRLLVSKQYSSAIDQYTQGLNLYRDNRKYNQTVSQQFQSLLYSLRGYTYSLNFDSENAEQDFQMSLKINPYNPVTLSRRAKYLMKQKRFSQAIEDIDLALLYDPQNLTYIAMLNSIQNCLNQIKDQNEKEHLRKLISSVRERLNAKTLEQTESEEQDDEEMLNFAKLKKIDRVSVKINPSKIMNSKNVIEFKQDQVLVYQKHQDNNDTQPQTVKVSSERQIMQKLQEQEQELNQLENQEQNCNQLKNSQQIILTKNHQKSRKSILRKSILGGKDSPFINLQKQTSTHRSSISAVSIKNIDGKLISQSGQNIKFRPSISSLSKTDLQGLATQIQIQKQNRTPVSRKSCFRSSKRFQGQSIQQQFMKTAPTKRTSNFLNIKNIDGGYKKSQLCSDQQQQKKIQSQSEVSDDQNQHDIFGHKKDRQVIRLFESMKVQKQKQNDFVSQSNSKKSILRKDSILGTNLWKSDKKKSVLFKTG